MNGEIGRAQQDVRAARGALRRAHRALNQLERTTGHELGRYELNLDEQFDVAEFVQFLRLAITGATSSIVIVVSQPTPGPDKENQHGEDV